MSVLPKEVIQEIIKGNNFQNSGEVLAFLKDAFKNVLQEMLEASKEYEQPTLNLLKQFTNGDHEIYLTSKLEAMRELSSAKMVLFVLGVSLALIIALIGVLNFVNVMSVGIMVRRHELAILESIGMSRRQVRKLLVRERLGYAVITLLLVFTIGNAVTLGIFTLFWQQTTYAAFSYPFFPVILVSMIIIAICVITPEAAYHSIYKNSTIIERLKGNRMK